MGKTQVCLGSGGTYRVWIQICLYRFNTEIDVILYDRKTFTH